MDSVPDVNFRTKFWKSWSSGGGNFSTACGCFTGTAHPSLRNHKLCGSPAGCRGCSAGYDLRIVFESAQHEGAVAILLLAVGMYDEVY